MSKITVVLLGVEHPGNLGAVCRAMKNFGFFDLLLIAPKCSPADVEAKNRAKWANDVLETAKVEQSLDALKEFDVVIGTTGKISDDYNLPRTPLFPSHLAQKLSEADDEARIALVFGRESDGMMNEELLKCDFTVTIPTHRKYPSLNLSHAVAVVLYAINGEQYGEKTGERFPLVRAAEKKQLEKMIGETLDLFTFAKDEKRETQDVLWKRLVGKSMITQREAMALMGFFRKVEYELKKNKK